MRIVLFGAPGSGKGTQAEMLAERFGLPKISLGDILRDEVRKGSDLGLKVKEIMERGDLVSDDLVAKVVEQNLNSDGFILDGYPRNQKQAETLDSILSRTNSAIDAFICLDVSPDIIINRLSKRRVCRACKVNYHLDSSPPKKDSLCDFCGAKLTQRSDDAPEVIRKRLKVFAEKSKGVFDFYKEKGIFFLVDGNKKIEEVLSEIKSKLEKSLGGLSGKIRGHKNES